jgi:uncharacterized protein
MEGRALAKASREFQIFAKPTGALCNLDCRYCYYLEKQRLLHASGSFRMPDALLERYIAQHIEASPGPTVTFSWHGGEPTILGMDYFRRIVELQRAHKPPGWRITNGLQTNGTLLDEAWCGFLAAERFGVGLSLDGPREMHDRYRLTKHRQPSHQEAMRGFKLLRRHRVSCDILCVVSDVNVRHPTEVYRFFKEIGGRYLTFLPLVERDKEVEAGVTPRSVPADAFGTFLCTIFDEWMRHDVGRIAVQIFEEALSPARGVQHSLCVFRETCGDVPVLEHNGDFFCCDHYVDPQHRLGNIRETSLSDLIESPRQRAFGRAKRDALPGCCRGCDVRVMCNGGCPKDRFIRTPDGEEGLNYLCAGFKRFFTHSLPGVVELASRERVDPMAPAATSAREEPFRRAGRNDPCPCGSGQKYKKCCLVAPSPPHEAGR